MEDFIFYYTIKFYYFVGSFYFNLILIFNIFIAIILGVYVYEKFK